ncbi:MAG: hypothetical protein AAGF93_00050 [Cyanobacteria bacterium P01_H01_bin.105]
MQNLQLRFKAELFRRAQPPWLQALILTGAISVCLNPADKKIVLRGNKYYHRALETQLSLETRLTRYAGWSISSESRDSKI